MVACDVNEKMRTPRANKGTHFTNGGGEAVELATNSGGASLCCEEAKAVARSQLAEAEEDTVDDRECGNMFRELLVEATHDEANDSLKQKTSDLDSFSARCNSP